MYAIAEKFNVVESSVHAYVDHVVRLNITNARMRCLLLAAEVTRLGTIRVDTDEDNGHGHFSCLKRHKAFAHTPSNNQCMRLPSNGARTPPCSSTAQLPLLRSCDFWYHFGTTMVTFRV